MIACMRKLLLSLDGPRQAGDQCGSSKYAIIDSLSFLFDILYVLIMEKEVIVFCSSFSPSLTLYLLESFDQGGIRFPYEN